MALLNDAAGYVTALTGCDAACFRRLTNELGEVWAMFGIAIFACFIAASILAILRPTRFLVAPMFRVGLGAAVVWFIPQALLFAFPLLIAGAAFYLAFAILVGLVIFGFAAFRLARRISTRH